MPDEHLSTEEISVLLDRGAERAGESQHLEECARCRRQMELLRRMRMALSALDDRDAPTGAWPSIEEELEERSVIESGGSGSADGPGVAALGDIGWLRGAAAVLLFAGGLGLGAVISSPDRSGTPDPGRAGSPAGDVADGGRAAAPAETRATPARPGRPRDGDPPASTRRASGSGQEEGGAPPAADRPGAATASGDERGRPGTEVGTPAELTYREAMERLESLRARGPSLREAYGDPRAAAEHLARLEALMRAGQEALREDPADPALNDFLFRVAEERAAFNRALRLSSLEYR